jgi:hypothetical protein
MPPENGNGSHIEQTILQALKDLRFGSVEIIVHDSKVVQIERREKVRVEVDSPRHPSSANHVRAS